MVTKTTPAPVRASALTLAGAWLLLGQFKTALQQTQFSGRDRDGVATCPQCQGDAVIGHRDICPIYLLLTDGPRRADAIDTLGLAVIRHKVEDDPKAECIGHFPTHVVETKHDILDGETVGELLARLGLDEGDRIEIRFPTVDEDVRKLALLIDAAMPAPAPGYEPAPRDADGRIVGVPDDDWGGDEYRDGVPPECLNDATEAR